MSKSFKYIFFLVAIWPSLAFAKISVGEWRTHFSYNGASQVVSADENVYVVANGKLYSWNSLQNSFKTYTRLDGMSGNTIAFIDWYGSTKTLIAVYTDGNIDFIKDGIVTNLADFKNKPLTADKTIHGLRVFEQTALISTGVGLLVVDLQNKEFSESYFLPFGASSTPCNDAVQWGDSLMVLSDAGIFTGNRRNNLQDVSYWSRVNFVAGCTPLQIVRFQNTFYVLCTNGQIYSGNSGNWTLFQTDASLKRLAVQDSKLVACGSYTTYLYNQNLQRIPFENIYVSQLSLNNASNKLYTASGSRGLIEWEFNGVTYVLSRDSIAPDGPSQTIAWNGFFKDGTYYATAGGRWTDRFFLDGDLLIFDKEEWLDMPGKSHMLTKLGFMPWDFINLAIDPKDDQHYFITTWGDGLLEFRKDTLYMQYTEKNSPLSSVIPGRYCRVDGATFDDDGNLWLLNSKFRSQTGAVSDTSLLILKPNGSWVPLPYAAMKASPNWNSILFAKNGQIWINSARVSYGIFVLSYQGTLENQTNVQTHFFSNFTDQDGKMISPWKIQCMAEDHNGTIWIGTNLGPLLAAGTSNVFDSDYYFSRVKIARNDGTDVADYLLNTIQINCIAIDGANRKWLGTEGQGLYLVSPDGSTTVSHFTNENSPLPSNVIWSITIDPETGEVFVGTDAGLVSYRGSAVDGKTNLSSVYVFPNPVKPNYNGVITVTGLMENTQVRIADMNGNTLIKGKSQGGQFGWSGLTSSGKKASSGVYLVFCSSDDGLESEMCKFMIIR